MTAAGRDELLCDFAETYRIYDLRSLPLQTAAVLACGLRDNSRIKMKLAGAEYTFEQMMSIHIFDKLNWLCWTKTRDAAKGRNRPEPLSEKLLNKNFGNDITAFSSADEFENARRRIMEGG